VNSSRAAFNVDAHLQWDVSDELFAKYRDLIHREAGIALTDGKKSLLVSRVAGRLRELGLTTFAQYYRLVEDPASTEERGRLLDRICTNETHFFRDPRQFLYLTDHVFPRLEADAERTGKKRVRAWSAACSSGEEPYSLALAWELSVGPRFPELALHVLATDDDETMLRRARAAEYPEGLALDLETAISRLPAGARTVFVLHDVEGFTHDEIADMTGSAAGTSKAQLFRARRLLRKWLDR